MKIVPVRMSEEELELLDMLMDERRQEESARLGRPRRVTRSSAIRDLLWGWSRGAPPPERPNHTHDNRRYGNEEPHERPRRVRRTY